MEGSSASFVVNCTDAVRSDGGAGSASGSNETVKDATWPGSIEAEDGRTEKSAWSVPLITPRAIVNV